MHYYAGNEAKGRSTRLGLAAAAVAMLALVLAAVACDPEDAQPTSPPPTATVVAPVPTPTEAPTATTEPTPEPTATPSSTPTPGPTPEPPSVQEILSASAAAMAAVETGSVILDGTAKLEGSLPIETTLVLTGDYQAPDRSRFNTVISSGGFSFEYDSVVIGADGYQENPFTGAWERSPDAVALLGESGYLGELKLDIEDDVARLINLVGVEEADGVRTYRLKASLPPFAAAYIAGDSSLEQDSQGAPVDMELWIGVEDSLVRKLSMGFQHTDALTGDSITAQTVMTFSDYGKSVDIQAPAVEDVEDFTLWQGEDDHGDNPATATRIAAGETAEGAIDNILDYDYFVFQAEEGAEYRIEVALGTLPDSALGLYDMYESEIGWNDDYGDTLASLIEWTAPASGEYYLAVGTADGSTGTYTLTVDEVQPAQQV